MTGRDKKKIRVETNTPKAASAKRAKALAQNLLPKL